MSGQKNRRNSLCRAVKNEMDLKRNLILALETAIEGGSISIWDFRAGIEIANLNGETGVSKAEDVLENIQILLKKNKIEKEAFGLVVFATEAGSATGLKIGEATAKGLAKSFDCLYQEISLWEALAGISAEGIEETEPPSIKKFFLPAGKGKVVVRTRQHRQFNGNPELISLPLFDLEVQNPAGFPTLYVHEKLLETDKRKSHIVGIRRNLAGYIGEVASDNEKYLV